MMNGKLRLLLSTLVMGVTLLTFSISMVSADTVIAEELNARGDAAARDTLVRMSTEGEYLVRETAWSRAGVSYNGAEKIAFAKEDLYADAQRYLTQYFPQLLDRFAGVELTGIAGEWSQTKKDPITQERTHVVGGTAVGYILLLPKG